MTPNVNGFPVKTSYVGTERLVYVTIDVTGSRNPFVFRTDYNWAIHFDFTRDELDIKNMETLIDFIHYVEPEPNYEEVRFDLSVSRSDVFQGCVVEDSSYTFDGIETTFMEADGWVSEDLIKTIALPIVVRSESNFIVRNVCFSKFFRFDLEQMTIDEVRIALDVIERYSPSTLLDLVYEYDPSNPVLVTYGYFD